MMRLGWLLLFAAVLAIEALSMIHLHHWLPGLI
jgi:hypothetical protein